jgi:hypothetical protein
MMAVHFAHEAAAAQHQQGNQKQQLKHSCYMSISIKRHLTFSTQQPGTLVGVQHDWAGPAAQLTDPDSAKCC